MEMLCKGLEESGCIDAVPGGGETVEAGDAVPVHDQCAVETSTGRDSWCSLDDGRTTCRCKRQKEEKKTLVSLDGRVTAAEPVTATGCRFLLWRLRGPVQSSPLTPTTSLSLLLFDGGNSSISQSAAHSSRIPLPRELLDDGALVSMRGDVAASRFSPHFCCHRGARLQFFGDRSHMHSRARLNGHVQ